MKQGPLLSRAWKSLHLFLAALFVSSEITIASAQGFDIAFVAGSQLFWANVAMVLPGQKIVLTNGELTIIDAQFCNAANDKVEYVFATSTVGGTPGKVLLAQDCDHASQAHFDGPPAASYDGRLAIAIKPMDPGIGFSVQSYVPKSGDNDNALVREARSLERKISVPPIVVDVPGGTLAIDVTSRLKDGNLVVTGSEQRFNHSLLDADLPSFSGYVGTNVAIIIPHSTVNTIVSSVLQGERYPIKGTALIAKNPSYTGENNKVTVAAKVDDPPNSAEYSVAAVWEGAQPVLSAFTAKSTLDCRRESLLHRPACEARRLQQNTLAAVASGVVLNGQRGTPMVPLNFSRPIKIKLFEKKLNLSIVTYSTRSSATALTMVGFVNVKGAE